MPLHVSLSPLYPLSGRRGCLLASLHRNITSTVCQSARKTVYSEWSQLFFTVRVTSRSSRSHKDNPMSAVFISAKRSLVFASTCPYFLDGSLRCCGRCFGSWVPRPRPPCPVHRGSVPLQMPTIYGSTLLLRELQQLTQIPGIRQAITTKQTVGQP